ncbi:hypothetical protein WA158_002434 [Blastocystis sp. Blastoise]
MSTLLENFAKYTQVVADTGDFNVISTLKPQDATTNPSLILGAALKPEYDSVVNKAIEYAKSHCAADKSDLMTILTDKLAVSFGKAILEVVPGLVSTEVDARLSFDTEKMIEKAHTLIRMYEEEGVSKDRILIKIASTWEGMKACKVLQAEGIHCNMTLLFTFCQAVAAANSNATLISPFVGRIRDWYMKKEGRTEAYPALEDPGVKSVRNIYSYYKKFQIPTIVMGASFRSVDEVLGLAGCDKLTIGPNWLKNMKETVAELPYTPLSPSTVNYEGEQIEMTEETFRWQLNEDAMATDLLADGIRKFAKDTEKLEAFLAQKL